MKKTIACAGQVQDLSKLSLRLRTLTLTEVTVEQSFTALPPHLRELHIDGQVNTSLDSLPPSLEVLRLNCQLGKKVQLDNLPDNLLELSLDKYAGGLDNLPVHLRSLDIGDSYNRKINLFPASLERLRLGKKYSRILPNLPETLRILVVSVNYPHCLPAHTAQVFVE